MGRPGPAAGEGEAAHLPRRRPPVEGGQADVHLGPPGCPSLVPLTLRLVETMICGHHRGAPRGGRFCPDWWLRHSGFPVCSNRGLIDAKFCIIRVAVCVRRCDSTACLSGCDFGQQTFVSDSSGRWKPELRAPARPSTGEGPLLGGRLALRPHVAGSQVSRHSCKGANYVMGPPPRP